MVNPRMPKKGERGAARNYITRTQAIKKLQCSLADFRRLCILKGIYPREPRNKKKANKGSTAPTSFYYVKDIQYLLHEPVLEKLREHKTFAKKLSRALGRGEYGLAKNLDQDKPQYRLDHIIKERYPTFQDSLRDVDDALSLIVLFAHLPSTTTVPAEVIQNCARLYAEWQLYVMRTRSLKKVFLSIKGIYYQAQVKGVSITWLVPYSFTQHVPTDIDFRIMMTFLDLYQTMLGFVFFKLYTDENLIYPPKLDASKEDEAAGLGALQIQEAANNLAIELQPGAEATAAKKVTTKEVKKQIKSITATATVSVADEPEEGEPADLQGDVQADEQEDAESKIFEHFHFYISREVTRPFLEFTIRSFGGKVGWDASLGSGSPFTENDPRITHHIVDRPMPTDPQALAELLQQRASYSGQRVFVQPQWVVDCVNSKTIKPAGMYAPGQILPPHLSPFVDDASIAKEGGYVPQEAGLALNAPAPEGAASEDEEEEEEEEAAFDDDEPLDEEGTSEYPPALLAAAQDPTSTSLRHAAELDAEARNVSHAAFERTLKEATAKFSKRGTKRSQPEEAAEEEGLETIMITGKKRKQYEDLQRQKKKRVAEKQNLERKRKALKM